MNIEEAKYEADKFAPDAAKYEAEFQDLKRLEPSVLAKCINKNTKPTQTYQWCKNAALNDSEYLEHLASMKMAQHKHLAADKAFRTIIEYLKAVQSENYKLQAKFKAGIL